MAVKVVEQLEGKFKFSVDESTNILYVEALGAYTDQEALAAFEAFNRVIAIYNPKNMTAILKFMDINYTDDDRSDVLIQLFQLYLNAGFPKVQMESPKSASARLQIEDAISDAGLDVELL